MIDGSEKRNRQLAFELQNSHVCEKRSNRKTDYESRQNQVAVVYTAGLRSNEPLYITKSSV